MSESLPVSAKRLLRVLAGETVWPPPLWLMRQAGRYLPEYRAVRARVKDFIALATTPELAADVTLQPIRRYRLDAAILFSDILLLPWAMGQGLAYRAGEGPVLPPLRDAAGVASLDTKGFLPRLEPVFTTVRRVRQMLVAEGLGDTSLIGFAGSPFTVACYMVEGGSSRDFAATRLMAFNQPALFARLLDVVSAATIAYLSAQIAAGAEAVMLFDSWAGVLSPGQFHEHVIRPTRDIVATLRQLHPGVPVIGFPRLAGMLIEEYVSATGVNAVGMDTGMDIALVRSLLRSNTALQGNLDPMALVAGGDALRREASAVLDALRGWPAVFNLGHGIVPQTPPAHVAQLAEQVRAG
ncbi:MAG TPA: uroporphyrinogen decarboxylase [Acetobacteraceae bacterium]|nr:uroporphyrinogen decarboxylase [Acetobacteraceae bacterium]